MMPRFTGNELPRMRFLPPRHALLVLANSLRGRHSPLKTVASTGQINAIDRHVKKTPTGEAVSYLQTGSPLGRRVVFVHGTPGTAKGWADYLLDVPQGRLHMALDRLGNGFSTPRQAVISLRHQARAVAQLLGREPHRKTIIVGHSSGAPVAVQAALDHPDRVGGILLLAGAMDPDLEEANWIQPLGLTKALSRFLPRVIDNANRELLGLKRELSVLGDRLNQLMMPVGIIHGDGDPLVSPANTDYLQRKLCHASLEILMLKGADHFIPWNSKPEVDAALESLIHKVRRKEDSH